MSNSRKALLEEFLLNEQCEGPMQFCHFDCIWDEDEDDDKCDIEFKKTFDYHCDYASELLSSGEAIQLKSIQNVFDEDGWQSLAEVYASHGYPVYVSENMIEIYLKGSYRNSQLNKQEENSNTLENIQVLIDEATEQQEPVTPPVSTISDIPAFIAAFYDANSEPLDGDEVEQITKLIKADLNYHQGNISEEEHLSIVSKLQLPCYPRM